jgi:hypothetical protein
MLYKMCIISKNYFNVCTLHLVQFIIHTNKCTTYMLIILYIKLNFSSCVCTLYKFTFLNQSEPDFAHSSPLVWKRPYGMYASKIFGHYDLFLSFCRFICHRSQCSSTSHVICGCHVVFEPSDR